MTAADNLKSNASKVSYTDYWPIDQVIFADTLTFSVPAGSVGTSYAPPNVATGLGQFGRPMGIYTEDGGSTYNDIGNHWAGGHAGAGIVVPIQPNNVELRLFVDGSGNVNFTFFRNVTTSSPTVVTCSFVLLAVDNPSPISSETQTGGAETNYNDQNLYRKIVDAGNYSTSGLSTVPHNLGYVPNIEYWISSGGDDFKEGMYYDPNNPNDTTGMFFDNENLYLGYGPNGGLEVLYRVYLEA